jgi:hypothetical protein
MTGATDRGLQVAAGAAVEVEARAETVGHGFRLGEVLLAGVEEQLLVGSQPGNRIARAQRIVPPRPRVFRAKLAWCRPGREQNDHTDDESNTSSHG